MELKIEEAKRLLKSDNNILIKEISDTLGFNDQYYFSKVFKSYTGYCPADFKNIYPINELGGAHEYVAEM